MFRINKLPELLAPAGDLECLYAAVAAGADAIYVGGKRFGARAFAKNFDIDELSGAVEYCHLHGVRLYVTLNTLIEDKEMADAISYAAELYRIGVDALIVADLGVASAIRRLIPDFELHASTQMSVHNALGADAAARLGVSRVVLARELSLADMTSATENSRPETEVFLHGALCVCHSGQCLFSSLVGGRSGNRGECAQPCRLPYNNGKYPLSLKDLCLAEHIPELIKSGVASLKIEGRMKSPTYVYTVTSIYRRLLDENRPANAAESETLRRAFSRDGFTDGYFVGNTASGMTGIRTKEDKEDSRMAEMPTFEPIRVPVRASVTMRLGEPCEMTLTDGKKTVKVTGQAPAMAENAPLTAEAVCQRLSKMGNTYLSLSPSDTLITLDENINLPPSAINALRRSAAEAFQSASRPLSEVEYTPVRVFNKQKPFATAQLFSKEAYLDALKTNPAVFDGFDVLFLPLMEYEGETNGVYLPPVIFDGELCEVVSALENAKKLGVMYALVGNISQIELVLSLGLTPIGDFRLNVCNSEARLAYEKMGVRYIVLSPELTLAKSRDIGGSVITYGRIPLMITERCFISENFGCEGCNKSSLVDRKGEKFPMRREFKHRNLIFNSVVTYLGDKERELDQYSVKAVHLLFTVEDGRQICDIVSAYKAKKPLSAPVRRAGRRQ